VLCGLGGHGARWHRFGGTRSKVAQVCGTVVDSGGSEHDPVFCLHQYVVETLGSKTSRVFGGVTASHKVLLSGTGVKKRDIWQCVCGMA
jgi:hypothetical protein